MKGFGIFGCGCVFWMVLFVQLYSKPESEMIEELRAKVEFFLNERDQEGLKKLFHEKLGNRKLVYLHVDWIGSDWMVSLPGVKFYVDFKPLYKMESISLDRDAVAEIEVVGAFWVYCWMPVYNIQEAYSREPRKLYTIIPLGMNEEELCLLPFEQSEEAMQPMMYSGEYPVLKVEYQYDIGYVPDTVPSDFVVLARGDKVYLTMTYDYVSRFTASSVLAIINDSIEEMSDKRIIAINLGEIPLETEGNPITIGKLDLGSAEDCAVSHVFNL